MNKIVREHYPVDRLPEDLREGIEGPYVSVTVVTEEAPAGVDERIEAILRNPKPMTIEEARARVGERGTTTEEAVARIRALRDEWDE
ncbi:conserved hypothetical protein [Ancylobacter novellus DSM 506]|uniref:Uncharacterized protein n=1 Tax=Ancylobacter novellus (strain ATCC 8093 / DSM 506 / JCM 20403 / CCM 1077 / IAM 12100 / NBRC 12443 / NCIMB 10456) TaxID=639283 RepID=D7A1X6_ANCN5|nr:hypothetical protein [Ancylobacter novellus]ADH87592.1 conserved hypothetical protein [Ancylobacter novellus DSM 506]